MDFREELKSKAKFKQQVDFILEYALYKESRGETLMLGEFLNNNNFSEEVIHALAACAKVLEVVDSEDLEALKNINTSGVDNGYCYSSDNGCFVQKVDVGDGCSHSVIRYRCVNSKNCDRRDCAAHYDSF